MKIMLNHKLHQGDSKLTPISIRSEKLSIEIMKCRKGYKDYAKPQKHILHRGGSKLSLISNRR